MLSFREGHGIEYPRINVLAVNDNCSVTKGEAELVSGLLQSCVFLVRYLLLSKAHSSSAGMLGGGAL